MIGSLLAPTFLHSVRAPHPCYSPKAGVQPHYKTLYTAFVKDVTEEVERRTEREMLSLVANETDNAVIITNPEGFIEYVNNGFERLTGYSRAEVKGLKPGALLQGQETDRMTVERIRQHIRNREPFYDEILNYKKNGEPYWVSLSINPVFDENRQLKNFISVQAKCAANSLILFTVSLTKRSISLLAARELAARFLTSSATTAKPRPTSPALAASIAAFNANKLVCSEIPLIVPIIWLIV